MAGRKKEAATSATSPSKRTRLAAPTATIRPEQWAHFDEEGYVVLDPSQVLDAASLAALQTRLDDIMLGKADVPYDKLMMQLDSTTGRYGDAGEQTLGHKGATLNYRKLEHLEVDPTFLAYLQLPVFDEACRRVYGADADISCFRAMVMSKPANMGTALPWHQDRWQHLDRDPLLTVYTALDAATLANGCVQIIPRSHKLGVVNKDHHSSFLRESDVVKHCPDDKIVNLELKAGQVALLHNWVIHRSGVNKTSHPRRAFSVNYMDAKTRTDRSVFEKNDIGGSSGYAEGGDQFPLVFKRS